MRLRRLELHGFKTFANPTTLEFPPGITAIVGPNGSGKSNVSDAIIWCLGEQNVRLLRGGKLQDVIFAGSSSRRATGLAEVSLVFDNSSRLLPLDYTEVSITRRVYRSDESEYFINRTPCRLRDIVDLFLDTGIGRDSYFALNQGEIDMILSADPEERRTLFEEAAGVKKYRVRKKESLRKLDTTRQNLNRIYDLIAEVEARVEPLERQALAARRYQELADRLHLAELAAFSADWSLLLRRIVENSVGLETARTKAAALDAELAALAAREEESRLALHESDRALEAAHRKHQETAAFLAESEGKIKVLQERLRAESVAAERASERLRDVQARVVERKEALALRSEDRDGVERSLRAVEARLSEARQAATAAESRWRAAAAALDAEQLQAVQSAARIARQQADREASTHRLATIRDRLQEIKARAEESAQRSAAVLGRREQIQRAVSDAATALSKAESEAEVAADRLKSLQADMAGLQEDMRTKEGRLAGEASRLRVLEELQEQREGYFKGVRAVLQAAAHHQIPGHYRAVADVIAVDRAHEAAFEAALGGSAQDIVTLTDTEARDGIYYLKRTGGGRATFLSVEMVSRLSRGGPRPVGQAPGLVGSALDLIKFEPLYRPIMEMLLGRILVFEDLENGNVAARKLSQWSRIVTLDGEVISSQGAMTGGSRQQTRVSIVGRSGQIQELQLAIEEGRRQLEECHSRRANFQSRIEELRKGRAAVEAKRQAAAAEAAQRGRDLEHLAAEEQRLQREDRSCQVDMEKTLAQEARESEALDGLGASVPKAGEATPANVDALRAGVSAAAIDRERLRDELSALLADEARLRERRRSAAAGVESAASQMSRLETEARQLASQAEGDASVGERARREIEALRQEMERLVLERDANVLVLETSRTAREALLGSLESISEVTRQANRAHQEQNHEIYTLEAARATLTMDRDRIYGVLVSDYDLLGGDELEAAPVSAEDEVRPANAGCQPRGDLSQSPGAGDNEPAAPGSAERFSERISLASEQMDEAVTAFLSAIKPSNQPDRDRQLAGRLRRQMRTLEPVNLEAIHESAEVLERLDFLKGQRGDIEAAARDLQAVIQKIDQEAHERFMATFKAIAGHFDELFRRLFGGGQTKLELTTPADPSNSGIDISAQPPGKKLQNLQLLSGGERSLTAVALLFAMLKVRPVPFCIMDEVDAALDEANVARFGEMVKEFAMNTQFVIITHNRGTMEAADRLFGVTITEPGVSRLLSVQLSDIEPTAKPGNGRHPLQVGQR